LPRLAERLEDLADLPFERETDLPFLPCASTGAEKGHTTQIMMKAAAHSLGKREVMGCTFCYSPAVSFSFKPFPLTEIFGL
jgi:hypothetical protein